MKSYWETGDLHCAKVLCYRLFTDHKGKFPLQWRHVAITTFPIQSKLALPTVHTWHHLSPEEMPEATAPPMHIRGDDTRETVRRIQIWGQWTEQLAQMCHKGQGQRANSRVSQIKRLKRLSQPRQCVTLD